MTDKILGDIRSVEDFREYHGDAANNMTNERITEKMYDAFLKDGGYKTGGYYERLTKNLKEKAVLQNLKFF